MSDKYTSPSRKVFMVFTYLIFVIYGLMCLLPMINVLAMSFSSSSAVAAGDVLFWPVGFTLASYQFVIESVEFLRAFWISIQRVAIGVPLNMLLTILVAYPLSKENKDLSGRQIYVWFFIITMLFNGGLIPLYMVVRAMGMLDTIWALLIPGALPIFNMVILLNFFRNLPKEIEEAAFIDGASHMRTLTTIILPLSVPSLATLTLFAAVFHWNSWFDGIIFMNRPENYPLASYLQTVIIQASNLIQNLTMADAQRFAAISDRTARSAQIFIGALPILAFYPILQKHFMAGIVLGSVKG